MCVKNNNETKSTSESYFQMVRTGQGTADWFQTGNGVCRGWYCHHAYLTICRVHHVKCQAGWSTSWNQDSQENINNLRYADDVTLMAESEEELKSLLVKEESEKACLKLSTQKIKIMASGPISSWQIDWETVETLTDLIFWVQNQCGWWLHLWNYNTFALLEEKLWQT